MPRDKDGLKDALPRSRFSNRTIGALAQKGSKRHMRGSTGSGSTKASQSTVYGQGRVVLGGKHPVRHRFKGKPGA